MKSMFKLFAFLYMFAPLIIVPYWAYSNDNWYFLFGIAFSYAGSYSSFAPRLKSFIFLFALLSIGVWLKTGFSIHQYITFFFFCSLWGYLTAKIAEEYNQLSKKGTLENDEELRTFLKDNPGYLQEEIRKWQEENPGRQLNFKVMDALARGRTPRESDYTGTTLKELTDRGVKNYYAKNPQVLADKIAKWKEQNPEKEVTEDIIDALAKNKKGILRD